MINCEYADFIFGKNKRRLICKLGFYGGQVTLGDCKICIQRGQNTAEYAAELAARAERAHPSSARKVSGCCDSALNPSF
jgi:hypothetical protein